MIRVPGTFREVGARPRGGSRRTILLAALGCLLPGPAPGADEPRPYGLSVEVVYGRQRSRATYLEEIQRSLEAWSAASAPLGTATQAGVADLHLRLVVDRIEVKRDYSGVRDPDAFVDPREPRRPAPHFSTLFELRVFVLDPHREDEILVEETLNVFNEQGQTQLIPDPQRRSWEINVQHLRSRLDHLLSKKEKKILGYLRSHDRLARP